MGTLTVRGAVVCLCGDIPASNFLGGFKEGVGFSFRKCRQCLCTKHDISQKVSTTNMCDGGIRTTKDIDYYYCIGSLATIYAI